MDAMVGIRKPVLQVADLRISYGARTVLSELGLTISEGEIFGLLGPNGAGKTSLIRTICGRVKLQSGRISISGQSNTKRAAIRCIGLVPQEIALYQHLTVQENLMVFGRLSGLSHKQTDLALPFAMSATKLESRANDYVHALSGGWKRRVNIAAAILHQPRLLILDEPTVGVDIDARNTLHEVIRGLSRNGLAVLLATHDLDQAQTLCTNVGFLRNGVIAPSGPPAQLLEEAFGTQREVLVELRAPALIRTQQVLRRIGFVEHPTGMEWRLMIDATAQKQTELTRALHRTDLEIKEVRFRAPGLDSLFSQITGSDRLP